MIYLLLKHFFKLRVHFKTRLEDRLRGKRLNEVEAEDIESELREETLERIRKKRWAVEKDDDKMTF